MVNTHKNIAVISLNHVDFINYVHNIIETKDIEENIIENNTKRITTNTHKYICIVNTNDMHSYSFDDIIKTPQSVNNEKLLEIMLNIIPHFMKDIDPEFVKIVNENFLDLLA